VAVPTVCAFLRGINLGSNRRVAMADLRAALEDAGFEDVRTHLQSGNVVVSSPKSATAVATAMEQAIEDRFGLRSDVIVRTVQQLAEVVSADPFAGRATNGSRYFVVFLPGKPKAAELKRLGADDFGKDEFAAGTREVYVWCPDGMRDSRLMKELGKGRLAPTATTRNWNTVTKLLEMAGP
jgi:uncharacterized protein (DUF1697 family)